MPIVREDGVEEEGEMGFSWGTWGSVWAKGGSRGRPAPVREADAEASVGDGLSNRPFFVDGCRVRRTVEANDVAEDVEHLVDARGGVEASEDGSRQVGKGDTASGGPRSFLPGP